MWTGPLFRCDTVPRMLVCIMGEAAWCFWCCGRSSVLGCLKCLSCVRISYDSQDHFIISRVDFYWKATRVCRWVGSLLPPHFPPGCCECSLSHQSFAKWKVNTSVYLTLSFLPDAFEWKCVINNSMLIDKECVSHPLWFSVDVTECV